LSDGKIFKALIRKIFLIKIMKYEKVENNFFSILNGATVQKLLSGFRHSKRI